MALVLLYNIKDEVKRLKIGYAARKLGFPVRCVAPEEFSQPVGYLLRLDGFSPSDAPAEAFEAEMLLMHGLSSAQFSGFLEALRQGAQGRGHGAQCQLVLRGALPRAAEGARGDEARGQERASLSRGFESFCLSDRKQGTALRFPVFASRRAVIAAPLCFK